MKKDYQLFRRTTPAWVRVFVASILAVALMFIDGSDERLGFVRAVISTATAPVKKVLHSSYQWFSDAFMHSYNVQVLAYENGELKAKQAADAARLIQLEQIEGDNAALRAELGLKDKQEVASIFAQVLYQVVDPYARKLVIDKGSNDGVVEGQPVITADGLLGQITGVTPLTSELTLVLDTKINIPVKVQRDHLEAALNPTARGFLSGKKEEGFLEIRFFNTQADLQVGDILVTSGLDGLYPEGLEVARVSKINQGENGQSDITLLPVTQGLSARYVTVLAIGDSKAAMDRSAEQAEGLVEDRLPTTLGARTREQTLAKERN